MCTSIIQKQHVLRGAWVCLKKPLAQVLLTRHVILLQFWWTTYQFTNNINKMAAIRQRGKLCQVALLENNWQFHVRYRDCNSRCRNGSTHYHKNNYSRQLIVSELYHGLKHSIIKDCEKQTRLYIQSPTNCLNHHYPEKSDIFHRIAKNARQSVTICQCPHNLWKQCKHHVLFRYTSVATFSYDQCLLKNLHVSASSKSSDNSTHKAYFSFTVLMGIMNFSKTKFLREKPICWKLRNDNI